MIPPIPLILESRGLLLASGMVVGVVVDAGAGVLVGVVVAGVDAWSSSFAATGAVAVAIAADGAVSKLYAAACAF